MSYSYNEPMFDWRVRFRHLLSGNWIVRFAMIGLCLLCVAPVLGQAGNQLPSQQQLPPPGQMPSGPVTPEEPNNPLEEKMLHQRMRALNDQRQKQLVEDTNKLLTLATQLKEEVDKSTKDTLSISVIKKADEIEKLAKSVKDKMKAQQIP